MAEHIADNNKVVIVGKVNGPMEFSHEIFGENFFQFDLSVPRLSDYVDLLPVTVSERLLSGIELLDGMEITVEGQLRSYNKIIGGHNRLILTVFAREIFLIGEGTKNPNQIYLNGFICKKPVYRVTPLKREITDILLAVNRAYGKSDYIPTIAWGRNARFSQHLNVGDNIKIWGRIQSRTYQKKLSNGEVIEKMAYEVSISKMEVVKNKIETQT
ncbi:MAG: single-stranded DNA-binding protein [Caldicoprobacterales bacterium]|jgi:primosomal replication protein N|nr:single-stranded DNA-binding protein [Clostridiales bacterium]